MISVKLGRTLILLLCAGLIFSCSTAPAEKSDGGGGGGGGGGVSTQNLPLKMGVDTPASLKLKLKNGAPRRIYAKGAILAPYRSPTYGNSPGYNMIQDIVYSLGQMEGFMAQNFIMVDTAIEGLTPQATPSFSNVTITYTQEFIDKIVAVTPDDEAIDLATLNGMVGMTESVPPFYYINSADPLFNREFYYEPDPNATDIPIMNIAWTTNKQRVKTEFISTNGGLTNQMLFTYDDTKKVGKMMFVYQSFTEVPATEEIVSIESNVYTNIGTLTNTDDTTNITTYVWTNTLPTSWTSNIQTTIQDLTMKQDPDSTKHGVWVSYSTKFSESNSYYSYEVIGYADDDGGYVTTTSVFRASGEMPDTWYFKEGFDALGDPTFNADSTDGIDWTTNTAPTGVFTGYTDDYTDYGTAAEQDIAAEDDYVADVYEDSGDKIVTITGAALDDYYFVFNTSISPEDIAAFNDGFEVPTLYEALVATGSGVDVNSVKVSYWDYSSYSQGTTIYLYKFDFDPYSPTYGYLLDTEYSTITP